MKKRILPVLAVLVCLILSGCAMRTVEQMYCPPRRSEEYSSLQSAIDGAMSNLEYAAPVSGENQQTVQRADLDADGKDEYLVFARGNSEKPLHILVFRMGEDGEYVLAENISCNGSYFEQVEYVELDGRPGMDLLVGRQLGGQTIRVASLFSFADGQAEQIFNTIYTRVITCDLDSNGRKELMVIRYGESELDKAVAVLYAWQNGVMERSREAMLSGKAEYIKRITLSNLEGGQSAVYVASAVNESVIVTDIFAVRNNVFSNISLASDTGTSVQTLRNYYIYSEDLDGDGVLELPRLLTMKSTSSQGNREKQYLIRWYSLNLLGREQDKYYTFHNYDGGWYLTLDSTWINRIAMEQDNNTYTFYIWNEDYGEAQAVFTVYSFTGPDRDSRAGEQNRFALYRGETVAYAAKLETASALYGITEEYLKGCFHLIQQDGKQGNSD